MTDILAINDISIGKASAPRETAMQHARIVRQQVTGQRIVAEARTWIGTKFVWQASVKGVGADCKGLVFGVARELGLPEAETFHAQVADYGIRVPVKLLREGMASVFDPVAWDDRQPGDVMLLKLRSIPMHLAILSGVSEGHERAIHAQIAPADVVTEAKLSALLVCHPVDSLWRWRS